MKYKLLIFFSLFLYQLGYSQKTIKNSLYEVIYSEEFEQPILLNYSYPDPFKFQSIQMSTDSLQLFTETFKQEFAEINAHETKSIYTALNGNYVDKEGNTYKIRPQSIQEATIEYPNARLLDTIITVEYIDRKDWTKPRGIKTSDDDDYVHPFDKSHLVPYTSFKEDSLTDYIFSYLNCALMHESLNNGLWSKLESYEHDLSKTSLLDVTVILSFINFEKTMGGAIIPDYFTKVLDYKIIKDNKEVSIKEIFHFPNHYTDKGNSLKNYKIN